MSRFALSIARSFSTSIAYAGEEIEYSRGGSSSSYCFKAIPGNALATVEGFETTRVLSDTKDFIFLLEGIADLGLPEEEDQITWNQKTYRVNSGDFSEVFNYTDPAELYVRVHAQEIANAA